MSLTADRVNGSHRLGGHDPPSRQLGGSLLRTTWELSNEELGWLAGHDSNESTQKEAFDELFRRLWRASVEWALYAGARRRHQAEDAATQAWVRAWRYRDRYDHEKARYGTWLGTIVKNETLDLLRAESRHAVAPQAENGDLDQLDPATQDDPDLIGPSYLWEAFDALRTDKPEFAAVLSLKAEGYRDEEIRVKLGLEKIGTVASRLSRAKKFMAEWLAGMGLVFLPQQAIGPVHPWRLKPLCRTSTGIFYGFSPLDGLFVLPTEISEPPGAEFISNGFFVRVWSYALQHFQVTTSEEDLPEDSQIVFKWNQYLVTRKAGCRGHVASFTSEGS